MIVKKTATDPKIVRQLNKAAILEAVQDRQQGVSRAEVARLTTLSRATVSAIVEDLLAADIVRESGMAASQGGRPPTLLRLNPDAGRVIGVDIGATHLLVVVADLRGKVLAEAESAFEIETGPEACLDQLDLLVHSALKRAGCALDGVEAIAVGVPGPVIAEKGMVSAPPIMPGWDGFPIRDRLTALWNRPVTVDNDADLGALGEWDFGAGQHESNLVYIKIGTGIGCGILIGGQIYHGVLGTAGEIGHVTISEDGPPCTCGNYGCLEAMAGGRAIAQRAQMAVKAGQRTILADKNHSETLTALDVAEAAKGGDVISQQLLGDAGRHIGSALASLINLLNPGLVIVGGGVTGAGDFLVEPIREAVAARSLRPALYATRILVADLGRRSTALGALSLALTRVFRSYVETGQKRPRR